MLKKVTLAVLFFAFTLSLTAANISAANISDSTVSMYISPSYDTYTAQTRQKDDTSYAYQYCTSSAGYHLSYVFGMKTNGSKYDASGGNTYGFVQGTQKSMINYVREKYNSNSTTYTNYAGMALYDSGSSGGGTRQVTIKWSPDSVGYYS